MRTRSRLLLSTSLLAIAFAATPLTIDFDVGEIGPTLAQAKCCFSGDTPVLMADGTVRRIRQVRVGDRILSRSGRANLVVGLEAVPLAGRCLFAINELAPFFTAEHPFLSPGGWKAVDPAAAARETAFLHLTPMQTGDLLVTARYSVAESQGATALAPGLALGVERIVTLRAVRPDADMTVFNLLLDGDHSYVANGFVVHNKGGEDDGGESGGSGESGSGGGGSGEGGSGGGGSGEGGSGGGGSGGGGSGEGGSGDGESGEGGSGGSDHGDVFSGTADRAGPDLSAEEERAIILRRWK